MSAFLLLIGLIVLLVFLPFAPFLLAVYFAAKLVVPDPSHQRSVTSKAMLVVAALVCLSPYVYVYGRQLYRNHLCESAIGTNLAFDPQLWARQHPAEALTVKPRNPSETRRQTGNNSYFETLNSRFAVTEEFIDRGLSVTEKHSAIIDTVAGTTVAHFRTFFTPMGSGKTFFTFQLATPKSCYAWPYYSALDALRHLKQTP